MKPPVCSICGKESFNEGRLIYFSETEEDKKINKRFEEPGFVGHPSNAVWFCEEHYQIAIKFKNLTKHEAFREIKKLI